MQQFQLKYNFLNDLDHTLLNSALLAIMMKKKDYFNLQF